MRIKALPLSQSKQKKRIEEVVTIQRGKDSWNQRPQTSGSSTPPLTHAPTCVRRLHAHHHCPHPLCSAPTATIVAGNRPPSPPSHLRRVAPTPSPPLRTRAPPPAPSTPISLKENHTPDKILYAKSQATPFSTPSPLRSQCLVIHGLKTIVHGS
jgi:hypothetical protein